MFLFLGMVAHMDSPIQVGLLRIVPSVGPAQAFAEQDGPFAPNVGVFGMNTVHEATYAPGQNVPGQV
jgi:hypothetical protein